MNPQRLSLNPSSLKIRFTRGFLRALMRINKQRPTSYSSMEICRQYRRVKIAADSSMALAVGSRRAWSRAMLWRIRSQAPHRASFRRLSTRTLRKRGIEEKPVKEFGFGQANVLRNLVPGGEAMDLCSLLDETAHYIKCLTTQVQVMRSITDFCST